MVSPDTATPSLPLAQRDLSGPLLTVIQDTVPFSCRRCGEVQDQCVVECFEKGAMAKNDTITKSDTRKRSVRACVRVCVCVHSEDARRD